MLPQFKCNGQQCMRSTGAPIQAETSPSGFGVMTSLLIILAAGLVQIKAVSIWLFIVVYALVSFYVP